jgi:hypothetical protein
MDIRPACFENKETDAMNALAGDRSGDKLRKGRRRGLSGLVGSYVADLRGWAAKLAADYGIAAALMLGGILAVFGAIAVGAVALFHFLELRYGPEIAFAALGGGLLVLAAILLLAGWGMMKRGAPPLPRPREQARAAKQMLMGSTISRAVSSLRANEAAKPDATTQLLLGAAAVVAVGWLVFHHVGPTAPGEQVRRG